MGWTYTWKPKSMSVQEYFQDQLADRYEILDSALKNLRTWYAAVRNKETEEVWAMVCLVDLRQGKDGYNFGYKDMDETMGPCERECPEKILKLLTPLKDDKTYAKQWREDCWVNIEKRKARPKVKEGNVLKFAQPIKFTDGHTFDTFKVSKYRNSFAFQAVHGYGLYRITNWRKRDFVVLS